MDNFMVTKRNLVNRQSILVLAAIFVLSLGFTVPGQTQGVVSVIGEVKAIDNTSNQMVVRADNGILFTATLSDKTQYLRAARGKPFLGKARRIGLLNVGTVVG